MEETFAKYINVNGELMDLSRPQVMGILNVTPDSFYADSRKQAEEDIVSRVHQIIEEGGCIIDIGAYSSRSDAEDVSPEEEMKRLKHGLQVIQREFPDTIISVDTFRADVARLLEAEKEPLYRVRKTWEDKDSQIGAYADLENEGEIFDVVINATSASLHDELPQVPRRVFSPHTLAYEMTYGKGLTPFLRCAQAAGAGRWVDGVGMLVEQAADAFAWWRGIRPETAAVIAALTIPLR